MDLFSYNTVSPTLQGIGTIAAVIPAIPVIQSLKTKSKPQSTNTLKPPLTRPKEPTTKTYKYRIQPLFLFISLFFLLYTSGGTFLTILTWNDPDHTILIPVTIPTILIPITIPITTRRIVTREPTN